MIHTLRVIDLIFLNQILSKNTGLTTEQLRNLTGCDYDTTNNVLKKLVLKGYINKRKEGKNVKIYPPGPHTQIGIMKIYSLISELEIIKGDE